MFKREIKVGRRSLCTIQLFVGGPSQPSALHRVASDQLPGKHHLTGGYLRPKVCAQPPEGQVSPTCERREHQLPPQLLRQLRILGNLDSSQLAIVSCTMGCNNKNLDTALHLQAMEKKDTGQG